MDEVVASRLEIDALAGCKLRECEHQRAIQPDHVALMNRPERQPTTNAAEGLPRRRFTVAELEQMTAAGILLEDERIELIGGEIVPMTPKGNHHEILKAALNLYWARRLPADLMFVTETTFRLSVDTYLEPDFVFYPKSTGLRGLNSTTARLVVEISDSSLGFDLGHKAGLYAGFAIAEPVGHRCCEAHDPPPSRSFAQWLSIDREARRRRSPRAGCGAGPGRHSR